MKHLVSVNKADANRTKTRKEEIASEKTSRLRNWQISSVAESFKQHGHLYVGILNLALHISNHSVSRALTIISNRSENKRKSKSTAKKLNAGDVDKSTVPRLKAAQLWKKVAAVVLSGSLSQSDNWVNQNKLSKMNHLSDLRSYDNFKPKTSVVSSRMRLGQDDFQTSARIDRIKWKTRSYKITNTFTFSSKM